MWITLYSDSNAHVVVGGEYESLENQPDPLYFLKLQYKTKDLKYKLSGEFVQLSHNFACVVARHVATITKRHILAQGGEG